MKRMILLLTVAALVVVMTVASAAPVFAQRNIESPYRGASEVLVPISSRNITSRSVPPDPRLPGRARPPLATRLSHSRTTDLFSAEAYTPKNPGNRGVADLHSAYPLQERVPLGQGCPRVLLKVCL